MSEERANLEKVLSNISRMVKFLSFEDVDKVTVFTDSISEIINNIVNNEEISDKTISALNIVISDICPTFGNPKEKVTRQLFNVFTNNTRRIT
jgi:hypothetical protein